MLTSIAIILLLGLLVGWFFSKVKLPSLLGMILVGIVLGPYCLNLMDESILAISGELRQIALVIILAGASVDDVFVIVVFTALTTLASTGELSGTSFLQIPVSIVLGILLGAEIFLFVLVGMAVDLRYALAAGIMVILLVVMALLFRMLGVVLSLIKTKLTSKERLFCAVAYTPKATVQAAIGTIPLAMGLECGSMVLTVAVVSILLTAPLGALLVDNLYKRLLSSQS